MPYGLTYKEILELIGRTVLYTPTARDIVRRSGLVQAFGEGGRGPITIVRLEYWLAYGGTSDEPMSGDNFFRFSPDPAPAGLYLGGPLTLMWLEGISQVRLNVTAITPSPTTRVQTAFGLIREDGTPGRFFADTAEQVYDEVSGEPTTNTQVYCDLTEEYTTSGWIDMHPSWLGNQVNVAIEWYDPNGADEDFEPVELGVCELQVR